MSVAAAIRQMLAAGLTIDQALTAVEAMEANAATAANGGQDGRTARQERNRRYYEKRLKASENRLNKTNSDDSDALRRNSDVSDAEPAEASRAHVVSCLEVKEVKKVKKDTLPTCPSDTPVPIRSAKPRKPLPEGWPADGFAQWWAIYPRRTAKGDAEKAFAAVARRADATFDALMDATRAFARSPPEPQFCPYPATWLNGKRYLDEPLNTGSSYPGRPPQADAAPRRRGTMFDAAVALEARLRSAQRGRPVDVDEPLDGRRTFVLEPEEIRPGRGFGGGF